MTMGLKIHRMIKEEGRSPEELEEEARRRKEMSDSILEIIYNKLISGRRSRSRKDLVGSVDEEEEGETWEV